MLLFLSGFGIFLGCCLITYIFFQGSNWSIVILFTLLIVILGIIKIVKYKKLSSIKKEKDNGRS